MPAGMWQIARTSYVTAITKSCFRQKIKIFLSSINVYFFVTQKISNFSLTTMKLLKIVFKHETYKINGIHIYMFFFFNVHVLRCITIFRRTLFNQNIRYIFGVIKKKKLKHVFLHDTIMFIKP